MPISSAIVDDLRREPPLATVGSRWRLMTDQVMGGVSAGSMTRDVVAGRAAIRLRGEVSLENSGGFVQMALDLSPDGGAVDASGWRGVELDVFGDGQAYNLHLRTDALTRPWQSYRQTFTAPAEWRTILLSFDAFVPHRTEAPLDARRLRRIGVVAIGRAFSPDLALGGLRFLAAPAAFDARTLDDDGRHAHTRAHRRQSAARALPGLTPATKRPLAR